MDTITKAEARECIAVLRPAAQAYERAKRTGVLTFDDELGWLDLRGWPPEQSDTPQLRLPI